MEEYQVEFYRKLDGNCPIEDFLNSLEEKMWAKVARNIDILEEFNLTLREPLVKPVEDGIFELRTQVGNDITRIFYFFFSGKKIILTNGFIKKTQKIPRIYIETAIEFKKEYLSRGLENEQLEKLSR